MTLIGRRSELAAVEQLLDRAATGGGIGGHLIVTGPPGVGKTALTGAAADLARARGIPVLRAAGTDLDSGLLIWEQLLGDLEAGELPPDAGPRDLDRVARAIARGGPRLLVVDDVDRAGTRAVAFLALLASRLGSGATVLIATAENPLGLTPELRLRGLTEPELAGLTADLPAEAVHAVWLASGGLPGAAIGLAGELAGLDAAAAPGCERPSWRSSAFMKSEPPETSTSRSTAAVDVGAAIVGRLACGGGRIEVGADSWRLAQARTREARWSGK
ncbi:ATP-binding protein [Streptosporangium subroseum]|uniref:ATP-binding protein n=1 Tax=Streptosporangium subroseum TaxID=106412 RepID=UPI00344A0057